MPHLGRADSRMERRPCRYAAVMGSARNRDHRVPGGRLLEWLGGGRADLSNTRQRHICLLATGRTAPPASHRTPAIRHGGLRLVLCTAILERPDNSQLPVLTP